MRSVKQRVLAWMLTAAMLCTLAAPVYAADEAVLTVDAPTATKTETDPVAEPDAIGETAEVPAEEATAEPAAEAPVEEATAEPAAEAPAEEATEEVAGEAEEDPVADLLANTPVDTSKYTYTKLDQKPMQDSVKVCSQQSDELAAGLAFDGNPATAWHNKWAGDSNRWIQWELGDTYMVGRLEYTRKQGNDKVNGDLNGKWDTVKIEITTDAAGVENRTWTTVFNGSLSECYEKTENPEFANVATINFTPVQASAMKVTITKAITVTANDNLANAAELAVYKVDAKDPDQPETPEDPNAIAGYELLDKEPMKNSAKADSQQDPAVDTDGPASWAFDGDNAKGWHTRWSGNAKPDEKGELPWTIEWELGGAKKVARLGYIRKTGASNGMWKDYTVYGKNGDNGNWEVLAEVKGQADAANDVEQTVDFKKPMAVTHMKVVVTATHNSGARAFASAGELNVYRPLTAAEVEPDALPYNKEYKQIPQETIKNPKASSEHANNADPHNGDGPAAWAFDGLNNSAWHVDYSKKIAPHSIEWELDGVKTVGQIGYIRNDNHGNNTGNGRWKDVTVEGLLEDGTTWKTLRIYSIKESAMDGDGSEVLIRFAPTKVKALKVTINDSYNQGNDKFAQAGEIRTYEVVDRHTCTLTVTPDTKTVNEGESFDLSCTLVDDQTHAEPAKSVITWEAQDSGVLTVAKQDGKTATVKANGTGTSLVRVTALVEGVVYSASCAVTVNKAEKSNVIAINGTDYTAASLQAAVEQFRAANAGVAVNSIVFKTGEVHKNDFEYITKHSADFDYELKTFRIEDAVVPVGLIDNAIPMNAFKLNGTKDVGLVNVYLGTNIKGIQESAFYKCGDLTSFEAPGVEFMGTNALGGLRNLEALDLPALKALNDNAIKDAYALRGIRLPSVTVLGHDAFKTFSKLADVTLGATVPQIQFRAPLTLANGPKAAGVTVHLPAGASAKYQADKNYKDAKWAGLTLSETALQIVTFNVDGVKAQLPVVAGKALGDNMPKAPVKEGFTFTGWTDANNAAVNETTVFNNDAVVTAQFSESGAPSNNVAEINGTGYKTLPEAFAAAQQNDTIKLLADVTLNETIGVANKLTLDLNGFKLVGSGKTVFQVEEAGNLTVQDNSTAQTGLIAGVYQNGDLTMKADSLVETIRNNGTLTVESGKIYGAVATGTVTNPNAIAVSALSGTVTVSGGEIWGVRAANTASEGNLNAIRTSSGATLNLTGNAVVGAAKVDTNALDSTYVALKNDGTTVINGNATVYGIHAGAKVSTAQVGGMNAGMNVIDSTKSLTIGGAASVLAAAGTDLKDAEIRAIAARGELTLEGGFVQGNGAYGAILLTDVHFVARESENAVPVVENQNGPAVAFAKNYPNATYEITGGIFKTPAVSEKFTDLNSAVASGYTTEQGNWDGKTWTKAADGAYLKVVQGAGEKAGWVEVDGGWKYRNEDGSYHTGWLQLNGIWYYCDENELMLTGWQDLSTGRFYFDQWGHMSESRWEMIDGKFYYFNEWGHNAINRWEQVDGLWYWFDAEGQMVIDWNYIDGNWYYFDVHGTMLLDWQYINDGWFYFNESGHMLTGWQYIGGNWFYLNASGYMLTGWQYIDGNWFYMNEWGHMVTDWQYIDGNWFYFNESGHMLTGWQYIGGNWFYLNESGHMLTGWQQLGGYWYYMDQSGHMVTEGQYIDGTWYDFDASGHML